MRLLFNKEKHFFLKCQKPQATFSISCKCKIVVKNLPSDVSGRDDVRVVDGAFSLLDVGSVVIIGGEKIEAGFHGFQFQLSEGSGTVHVDLVLVGQDGLEKRVRKTGKVNGVLLGS